MKRQALMKRQASWLCMVLLVCGAGRAWADEPAPPEAVPQAGPGLSETIGASRPAMPGHVFQGLNRAGAETWRRIRDSAIVIRVPGGRFLKRPYEGTGAFADPSPVHVASFFVDQHEVTAGQVRACLAALGGTPEGWFGDESVFAATGDRHPAVGLTGLGAQGYAKWVGGRLPTVDEWEKAAGGPDGRLYPWGSEAPDATRAHFGGIHARGTLPVGSFHGGASPYGVLDMAGNVYERAVAPGTRGDLPVIIKGGSWLSPHPLNLRVLDMCVQPMAVGDRSVGFRVVMEDPQPARPVWQDPEAPTLRLTADLSAALEEAQGRNVPLFLTLHQDTCGQCDRVRAQLFRDPRFVAFANEHLVVAAGLHPGDGALQAARTGKTLPSPWPQVSRRDLQLLFHRGRSIVGLFRTTPGNYLLDPHAVGGRDPSKVVLVSDDELPKWGGGVDRYLAAFGRAQAALKKRHGPVTPWTPEPDAQGDDE